MRKLLSSERNALLKIQCLGLDITHIVLKTRKFKQQYRRFFQKMVPDVAKLVENITGSHIKNVLRTLLAKKVESAPEINNTYVKSGKMVQFKALNVVKQKGLKFLTSYIHTDSFDTLNIFNRSSINMYVNQTCMSQILSQRAQ